MAHPVVVYLCPVHDCPCPLRRHQLVPHLHPARLVVMVAPSSDRVDTVRVDHQHQCDLALVSQDIEDLHPVAYCSRMLVDSKEAVWAHNRWAYTADVAGRFLGNIAATAVVAGSRSAILVVLDQDFVPARPSCRHRAYEAEVDSRPCHHPILEEVVFAYCSSLDSVAVVVAAVVVGRWVHLAHQVADLQPAAASHLHRLGNCAHQPDHRSTAVEIAVGSAFVVAAAVAVAVDRRHLASLAYGAVVVVQTNQVAA